MVSKDPNWFAWSAGQFQKHKQDDLIINAIIYAELAYSYTSQAKLDRMVHDFGLQIIQMPRSGLFAAAEAFKAYRKRGGSRVRPLPDFFIGAHAQASNYLLLTRDVKRYRTYFPTVPLITP